jgi:hypothetical protein
LFCAVIWLALIVARVHVRPRRIVLGLLHFFNLCWLSLGIVVILFADMKCPHQSLWAMAVAKVTITGCVFAIAALLWLCSGRCGRYLTSAAEY